jgi:hypothetical protein
MYVCLLFSLGGVRWLMRLGDSAAPTAEIRSCCTASNPRTNLFIFVLVFISLSLFLVVLIRLFVQADGGTPDALGSPSADSIYTDESESYTADTQSVGHEGDVDIADEDGSDDDA